MKSTLGRVIAAPLAPGPLIAVAGLTLLLVLGVADAAHAAADIKNAGKNIATTLETWAKVLFGGVTGIMAVYFLMQRKIGPALGFVGLAMLVGAFVFAPDQMGGASESIAKTILK